MNLTDVALAYRAAGLCVLPARLADKRPALPSWKEFQKRLPTEEEVRAWFAGAEALCILCGEVSGRLEMIDFDQKGELLDAWLENVCTTAPQLLDKLVIEQSQNRGSHVIYRCAETVCGNLRLAERLVTVPDGTEAVLNGKRCKPRKACDRWTVTLTLIETRGEGGLFLCAPSPGYELKLGQFEQFAVVTPEERDVLLSAAYALNECLPQPDPIAVSSAGESGRPGDEFNRQGDVRALLKKHGWTLYREGENEHWSRPGKERGTSATLKNNTLYVFSSNAAPFEQNKAYSPFGVYAHLEHEGDFRKAATALCEAGYGSITTASGVDLSGILTNTSTETASAILTPRALFEYDASDDPNTLLGQRWLCRMGSCLIVGQTGLGKSSFSMQAAVTWALGEALFGIEPVRPLRSLVIQAENDLGDLSEMFCGVLHGTERLDRLDELDTRIVFVTETAVCGKAFHPWARSLVLRHKPDLVWIDPLFAFLGGNASDQETVTAFLRNGLGAIAQETGCCWMIVHHANKPPRDPATRNAMLGGDYAYFGSGSAELANWARAVLTLREVENDTYELRASKRGRRAGLLDAEDKVATEVFLRHGAKGICWERAENPEAGRIRDEQSEAQEIIDAMEIGKQYTQVEVRKVMQSVMGLKRNSITGKGRRANRIFNIVLERTRHPQMPLSHCRMASH